MSYRSARKNAGLSVQDVKKALGVSDTAVYLWETGVSNPKATNMVKLAALYGCTVDELLRPEEAV